MFADDENRIICVSSCKFSVCGRELAHLTESTTKNGFHRTPETDKQNQGTTKITKNEKSKSQIPIFNIMEKTQYI